MNREFAGNALLVVVLNLVVKSFYLFGIDRTVQNALPPGEYGLYFTLFNFAFLFQILSDFGLHNYNLRNLSQSRHLLQKYFPHLLALKLLLGVGFVAVTVGVGWVWGFGAHIYLLLFVALNQLLQTFLLFLRTNLSGLGFYRLDSWVSVLDKSLLILIGGALLWWPPLRAHFSLLTFVWAHTATYLIAIGVVGWVLLPHLSGGALLRWHRPTLLWLLRASMPFALILFLMTAYTRLDAVMIEKLLPDGALQADWYASAFRLLDAANMAGYLLAGLLLPMFARLLKEQSSVLPLAQLSISTIWAGAITLAVSVYAFADPLMGSLYSHDSRHTADILRWLILTFIPMGGGYVYGSLLVAQGSLRPLNAIFAIGLVANVVLNLVFIPTWGAAGAAMATLVTQSLVFVGQYGAAHRILHLPHDWGLWLRAAALAAIVAGFSAACPAFLPGWPWLVHFLASMGVGGIAALALGLIDVRAWLGNF